MARPVLPPPAAGGVNQKMSASFANSFRIAAVAERLATHIQFGSIGNSTEFFGLCLSLARGIDYAVANNEVPPKAHELPLLLKQVCQRKNDLFLQAAIMVLMISVKNACKFGWFTTKDTEELFTLANEIGNSFCSPGDISSSLGDSFSVIQIITSRGIAPENFQGGKAFYEQFLRQRLISLPFCRFYPEMKMGHILASLEAKPGYGAYVVDFHISKNTMHSPQEKIRLFVAQRDNTDTSACIISPQQVNFLLNGKGVERRTNVSMDTGPQLPTNVTAMLKYGTNLLQAVGQFNGHYIIVVAFMSVTPLSGTPKLQDYVQSNVAAADPDSDIIEGPSRVSLNCPISYTRIKTPVKGHSCKHLQCFDFRNFVGINLRRPSWRCPHCNQHLCYTDIRIDQNMVKVLKEVGENVADVIISADGSWKAVLESDETTDQTQRASISYQKEMPEQQEPASSLVAPLVVVDLTEDNDGMDVVNISDIEDRKPVQSQPMASNLSMPSLLSNATGVDQNVASQAQDEFWSGVHFSNGSGTSNAGLGLQDGFPEQAPTNIMTSPVITDAISSALNRDIGSQGNSNLTPLMQNLIFVSGNLHLQQSQMVNNTEYGRSAQIPRNVSRTPIAIQALPALSQTPTQPQRLRAQSSSVIPNGSSLSQATMSMTPTATGFSTNSNRMDRQLQFPRSHTSLQQTSLPLRHHSPAQNWNHQDQSFISQQSGQQVASLPTSGQLSGPSRGSFALHNESQNLQQQQAIRITQARSQSPSLGRSSPALPRSQTQQGVAQVGAGSGNTASYINRFTVPVQFPTSRGGTSYSNTDVNRTPAVVQRGNVGAAQVNPGSDNVTSSEQNWRPTGRMRGSLSSQAVAAYGDLIIQPTQLSQAPQPQPNLVSSPPNIPPNMQGFLANRRNFHVSQAQTSPATQLASANGSSGTLP